MSLILNAFFIYYLHLRTPALSKLVPATGWYTFRGYLSHHKGIIRANRLHSGAKRGQTCAKLAQWGIETLTTYREQKYIICAFVQVERKARVWSWMKQFLLLTLRDDGRLYYCVRDFVKKRPIVNIQHSKYLSFRKKKLL